MHPFQDYGVRYWLSKGAIAEKFILGMGTYGKTFKIGDDASGKGVGVSASGSGTSGKYTREGGFLSYYEVGEKLRREGGLCNVQGREGD